MVTSEIRRLDIQYVSPLSCQSGSQFILRKAKAEPGELKILSVYYTVELKLSSWTRGEQGKLANLESRLGTKSKINTASNG